MASQHRDPGTTGSRSGTAGSHRQRDRSEPHHRRLPPPHRQRSADRSARRRLLSRPRWPVFHDDARRPRRHRHQGRGPEWRRHQELGPPVRDEDATYYLSINRNKYDIVLDFSDADDLDVAQKLAARADIIVENFKPGGLKKFGLDYDSVRTPMPRSSTPRSPVSAPTIHCPGTTCWCRLCPVS